MARIKPIRAVSILHKIFIIKYLRYRPLYHINYMSRNWDYWIKWFSLTKIEPIGLQFVRSLNRHQ